MFFMGEEVGAKEPYRYNDWLYHREDLQALRATSGAKLFEFYRDVIRLRRQYSALRSPHVEVLHVQDANRVLAFRRWLGQQGISHCREPQQRPFRGRLSDFT
jgi:1,4-alpha-glucan branching enzyme